MATNATHGLILRFTSPWRKLSSLTKIYFLDLNGYVFNEIIHQRFGTQENTSGTLLRIIILQNIDHIHGGVFLVCVVLCFARVLIVIRNGMEHDDVINWKHFLRNWPFVRGIHQLPVNSPRKGQWRGALNFSLISAWINGWVNIREAGDLGSHRAHYDVNIMCFTDAAAMIILRHRRIWLSLEKHKHMYMKICRSYDTYERGTVFIWNFIQNASAINFKKGI